KLLTMNCKLNRLSNGLRVITVPMPSMESATVTIWVGVGSRFETDKIAGLSHFLEHMVFKGSKRRPSAKKISEAIDAIGGEFNAGTSKEWTNFYVKARAEKLDIAFDVLSDMVLNPLLKKGDIDREKGVILEEMAMYEDTPMVKISDYFERLIFKGNPLGRDTIGTKESIKAITRDDFERYREIHYGNNNMLITVAGGVKEGRALLLAEKYFGELESKSKSKTKKFKSKQKEPRVKLHSKKNEQAHFILGFHASPMGAKERFVEGVLCTILGQGMSSRLFTEVREKRGLAYAVATNIDRAVDAGHIATYAGVDVKRIDEAIKVTLDEHYKLASGRSGITKEELTKAKEYIKGHLALSLEDTKGINSFFGIRQLLLNKVETPNDVFKGVDKVTIDEVLRVSRELFVPERLSLAIIGPYKNQAKFEKLIT
ncbi:MAG: pitrilysin family protein, partial [Microgenomates group bacterium]